MKETCDYMKHMKHRKKPRAYLYTCKKCHNTEDKRDKPYKDGSWCHCECGHNTFTCTICWKPVKMINGMYWYVNPYGTFALQKAINTG